MKKIHDTVKTKFLCFNYIFICNRFKKVWLQYEYNYLKSCKSINILVEVSPIWTDFTSFCAHGGWEDGKYWYIATMFNRCNHRTRWQLITKPESADYNSRLRCPICTFLETHVFKEKIFKKNCFYKIRLLWTKQETRVCFLTGGHVSDVVLNTESVWSGVLAAVCKVLISYLQRYCGGFCALCCVCSDWGSWRVREWGVFCIWFARWLSLSAQSFSWITELSI